MVRGFGYVVLAISTTTSLVIIGGLVWVFVAAGTASAEGAIFVLATLIFMTISITVGVRLGLRLKKGMYPNDPKR